MTEDPSKNKPTNLDIPGSEPEANSEAKVTLLKRGLLILIFFGIGMLIATAWYMTKRYWR